MNGMRQRAAAYSRQLYNVFVELTRRTGRSLARWLTRTSAASPSTEGHHQGRRIWAICLALVAIVCAQSAYSIWRGHREAIEGRQREAANLSLMLVTQTSRYIKVVDLLLEAVEIQLKGFGIDSTASFRTRLSQPDIHDNLEFRVGSIPGWNALLLIDAEGRLVNSSRAGAVPPVSAADRDFFQHFQQGTNRGIYIGGSAKSRVVGAWTMFMARPIFASDGGFLGLVVAAIDVRPFLGFYQAILSDDAMSITLARGDGAVLIEYPDPDGTIGTNIPAGSPWYRVAAAKGGTYRVEHTQTGSSSIVTVRALDDYPLVINVAVSEDSALTAWRHRAIETSLITLLSAGSFIAMFWLMSRDSARRSKAEAALRSSQEIIHGILDTIPARVFWKSKDLVYLGCNTMFARDAGCESPDQVIGKSDYDMGWAAQADLYRDDDCRVIDSGCPRLLIEEPQTTPDGKALTLLTNKIPLRGKDGRIEGVLGTYMDITELRAAESMIEHLARHDALTDLPNRVLFRERLERALLHAKRGAAFALHYLDLDQFKGVNDTLGHPIGDRLLQMAAKRLQSGIRETDTVARLGGDEFAILQVGVTSPTNATELASRLIQLIGEPFDIDGHLIVIGASIGIAFAPQDGRDTDQLMKSADLALYRAKDDGRGIYRLFQVEMDAAMQARRILELDLRQALRNEEFDLFFQPLIDMKMKRPVGCEALLRWRHPTKGLVPPDQFIALAEETGLIVPIGAWVLRRACTAAAEWPGRLKVAVNLSPVQFKKRGLVDLIATSLQESGLEPERLEIEITESVMLQDTPATLAILRQLQKMGIKIAMDDFGTGYSSLSYLRQFPFDRIKIDQSFVRGLGSSQDCAAIVYAVSALGSNLGMAITAEGVETWAQLNALENTGCSEVQGYLFSPAVSQGELIALLQRTPSGFETDPALMPSAPVCAPAT